MDNSPEVDRTGRNADLRSQWDRTGSVIIKSSIKKAKMNYRDVERELSKMGYAQNARTIASKLSRGGYSAAFFLRCLRASGATTVELPDEA
jgi:hypothetical protein